MLVASHTGKLVWVVFGPSPGGGLFVYLPELKTRYVFMNNQNQIEAKKYSLSVLSLVAWVVGLGTALVGVTLFTKNLFAGILVILAASVMMPLTYSFIKSKVNFSLSRSARIFFYTLFVVFGTMGLIFSSDDQVAVAPVSTQKVVFDIPSLVGKDVKQLREILGTPSYDKEPTSQQAALFDTWEKTWTREGYDLMVTYNIKNKKVVDLFLGADTDAAYAVFENTNNILKVGNLQTNSSEYSVKFIKAIKDTGYTGATIVKRI